MSSALVLGLEVASEATYGNPAAATGVPTVSGLTFIPMEFERGSITTVGGASELTEDGSAHAGFFGLPPEVNTSWSAGARVPRQRGSFTINAQVRGFGSGNGGASANANSAPLTLLWGTITSVLDTGGAEVTPTTGALNGRSITVTTGTTLAPGEVVLANIDGCVVANRVTDVAVGVSDTVTFELAWPRQLTTADRIQRGMQFRCRTGANSGAKGLSVALRFSTLDATMVAFGCRCESLSFSSVGGKLMVAMVVQSQFIVADVLGAPVAPPTAVRMGAAVCTLNGAGGLVSTTNVNGAAVPVSVASAERPFERESWSFTLTATLAPIGSGCGAMGISDLEVSNLVAELAYTSRVIDDADESDLLNEVMRGITWAAAPIDDGTTKFNGWGVSIPAGFLTADNNVTVGGEVLEQARTYRAGLYDGDDPTSGINVSMFLGGT